MWLVIVKVVVVRRGDLWGKNEFNMFFICISFLR